MNYKQLLGIILLGFFCHFLCARAPHIGDRLGPMSEILCDADSDWDIFTCEIIENYRLDNNIGHLAVVQEIFRGAVPDTIHLSITFIGCSMGSPPLKKLVPGSRHLIFGVQQANGKYLTRYGYQWHSGILNLKFNEKYREIEERSKKYVKVIREYKALQDSKFSGPVSLQVEEYCSATGQFLNGQPHGEWIHADLSSNRYGLEIKAYYNQGRLHGTKSYGQLKKGIELISFVETYENGVLISSESYYDNDPKRIHRKYSNRFEDAILARTQIEYDSIGDKVSEQTATKITNGLFWNNNVSHGRYINRKKYRYSKLCSEGNYYYGAKIGPWTYYNNEGEVDSTVNYPIPINSSFDFCFYHPDGTIAAEGNMIEGHPEGVWHEYDDAGKLLGKVTYKNGLINGLVERPNKAYTCIDNKRNGMSKTYYNNGSLFKMEHYKNDFLDGPSSEYYSTGQLKRKASYKNGHLIGTDQEYNSEGKLIKETNYDNKGAKTGYHKTHDSLGKLLAEGVYVNGYKSGVWLLRTSTGNVIEKEYPIDINILMSKIKPPLPKTKVIQYDPAIHSR